MAETGVDGGVRDRQFSQFMVCILTRAAFRKRDSRKCQRLSSPTELGLLGPSGVVSYLQSFARDAEEGFGGRRSEI